MSKRIAIYARVSTDEQGKNYSLPTQLEGCREYAQEHGYSVAYEFQEDYTGTKLSRPEFDKLRTLIDTGKIERVVTYELDRLARKMLHQLLIEDDFRKKNVLVDYVLGEYPDTPEGQFNKQIRASVAEFEREIIRERMIRGRKGRAQAGFVVPGGFSMYGYTYVNSPEGHKGYYEVNPAEAAIVRQIFEWYTVGDEHSVKLGIRAIARKLSAMGVPTRFDEVRQKQKMRDSGVWSEYSIAKMLKRESYTGNHYYNRTQKVDGKARKRDRSEWIPIRVPAIIERSVWETAQTQAVANTSEAKHNTRYHYLLKGILRCAMCGKRFNCDADTRYNTLQYYRCCGQDTIFSKDLKTVTCSRSLKVEKTDALVWAHIQAFLEDHATILQARQDEQAETTTEVRVLEERETTFRKQVASYHKQKDKLLDTFLDPDAPISKEMYKNKTKALQVQIESCKSALVDVRKQIEQRSTQHTVLEDVESYAVSLREGLENLTFDQKRRILMELNVQVLTQRGSTSAEDMLILSGTFPGLLTKYDSVVPHFSG